MPQKEMFPFSTKFLIVVESSSFCDVLTATSASARLKTSFFVVGIGSISTASKVFKSVVKTLRATSRTATNVRCQLSLAERSVVNSSKEEI